jgi:hypothetical protein
MSKLFFFLKSINKSQRLLNKILEHHKHLASIINSSRYYAYQNFLKTKLGRYLTMDNLQEMFKLVDETY